MRSLFNYFTDKSWKINLLLLLCSFTIYFVYFSNVFLNLNSLLAGITGDALKNYYTYSYHIKNDASALHFGGMNYPFGEHIVFTDCQPILTFILRLFPFTHNYLIGILHGLLFASYIITPLILNRIFRRLDIDAFSAFFFSLGITLLSPQFAKINGGHHALAYGCVIPLSILLILDFIKQPGWLHVSRLFLLNLALFFLHPYMGFSASLFSFTALLVYFVISWDKKTIAWNLTGTAVAGIVPLFLFQLFMQLSDQHTGRTSEPHGSKTLVENVDSLLAPDFGPFQSFLEGLFPNKIGHLEGHSYLGAFTILLLLLLLLSLPFLYRKLTFRKEITAILASAFFLLLISFGLHIKLIEILHIKNASLNQFRATCRFAWFFYYALPLFMLPALYHAFVRTENRFVKNYVLPFTALVFFISNLWEANSYLKKDEEHFWKFRNVLNEKFLNTEEREILRRMKASQVQAILPLPLFAVGSEMYDRLGADYSLIPSMLYSFHNATPILGTAMSRTSITETETFLQLLNPYRKKNPLLGLISDKPFLVIKTKDVLMADEDRLLSVVKLFHQNDSLQFGELNKMGLKARKLNNTLVYVKRNEVPDTSGIVYIPWENRKPYLTAKISDYETLYTLDSNLIEPGNYILSFHYHYTKKVYTSLNTNLIINKTGGTEPGWRYFQHMSLLSGFYPGFGVFEFKIVLEKDGRYEFMLKGDEEGLNYYISNFMLRPEHISVIAVEKADSLFNNFPGY